MVKSKTQKKHRRHTGILYDTDVVAKNLWLRLLRDFRLKEGDSFAHGAERAFLAGITEFRDYKFPELGIVSVGRFQRWKQLESFLKKYRFANDKYTDEELEIITHGKYLREQELLATPKPCSALAALVLKRARKIARVVLGQYDPEYTVVSSRFGKKSSIGCPLSLAYIDHKLTDAGAFTGTKECSNWFFDSVLGGDPILSKLIHDMGIHPLDEKLQHESLSLVNVPKTWKTHRSITPLTLLGLYYSYGVGDQVTDRLRAIGLDIRRLQSRHRVMIKGYSMNKTHATADLSSASQSLTSDLLNRILPRQWFNAIRKTFVRQVNIPGVGLSYAESVLPMGNGLTFPVETLVFYVVLKAIAELSGVRGRISVYGDDLIYPVKLHRYVAVIFPQLDFLLNLDKTFVKAPFRESCGSDYYRGVDVRPSFLPGEHRLLTRTKYASWLYKTYNSLVRRWDPELISSTLSHILRELALTGLKLYRVPVSFPDTAGIKTLDPAEVPQGTWIYDWSPVKEVFFDGSYWLDFSYLTVTPNQRVVVSTLPYYWLSLQGRDDTPELDKFWEIGFNPHLEAPRQALTWATLKCVTKVKLSNGKYKRIERKRQFATCPTRNGSTVATANSIHTIGKTRTGSISFWA